MKTLTLPPKFRKHTLALAISSLLSMALASAHAANPPLQAGPGVDLIASGDYESNTGFALRAFGGGSIATSGLVNVLNTNTVNGVGLSIIGAGSLIDFQGGTINAKVGVQADSGARVNISNTTITASDTGILLGLPDFGPSQVYVTNSQINASATAGVVPELGVIVGIGSYFGRAYGSRVEITDSAIQASGGAGIPAVGIHGYGINIVMNGGSIVASNNGAGVMVSDGYTELNNVDISADAGGVAISGGNVGTPTDTVINGSRIISNGGSGLSISSLGVESVRTVVNDTQIVSTGPNGIGVVVGGAKNTLQLSNSTISTAGTGSSGIQVGGGAVGTAQVTLSNTDIVTTGDQADGVRASQGTILQTSGGSIQTYGANANGVYLNASYTGVGVSASMNGTAIATHGTGASGLFVSQSDMLFANASITTGGDDAPAVWAASGNTTILLGQDDVISTQGVNSDGLRSGNPLTGEAGTLTLQGGTVRVSGDAASGVQVHAGASATLLDTSVQSSGANGSALSMVGGNGAAATAQISNSTLHSTQGAAIQVGGANGGQVAIDLLNGTQVSSGIGVFLNAAAGTQTTFSMNNQVKASGDIIANGNAIVDVSLEDQSLWSGMTSTVRNMSVDSRSEWQMTDSSVVQNLNLSNAGLISFIAPVAGSYHTLTVQGDITGQNGVVALNTVLNEGGALANQHTDRLLVEGNATGTTLIEVKPTGSGAPTDLRQNGQVNADEGISIVQVGGDSHAGAFALKGGYVAAGPWQYTLHAFGPGEADPSQSLLPGGKLNWDYRLGNTFVCEGGCEPDEPEKPEEPGKPGEPEESELPHPG
ncbi:pertactin-like passenger domain-containing protein, partial [Collimonas sp. H4R21]